MKIKFFAAAALLAALVLPAPGHLLAQGPSPVLDHGSVECMGCHQDPAAVSEPLRYCHDGGCDHPVGTSYTAVSAGNAGLVAPERLSSGVRLFDGRIGCLTCHTPYTPDHEKQAASAPGSMLSMDNAGSGLCVACHRK